MVSQFDTGMLPSMENVKIRILLRRVRGVSAHRRFDPRLESEIPNDRDVRNKFNTHSHTQILLLSPTPFRRHSQNVFEKPLRVP